ncbi:MAG: alpha-glucuronidase [Prevotellaceae bacterium]|jgi:alpha-glucuronidase|nr:alpha-glucuronidase [Prevotellaceae bacterium]
MKFLQLTLFLMFAQAVYAEDGSRLWLRYQENSSRAEVICKHKITPTIAVAKQELESNWKGRKIYLQILSSKKTSPHPDDSFSIISKANEIVISSISEVGLLYGAYHLLRLQETAQLTDNVNISETPKYNLRILNHWDNLDGTVERGYAGGSLWQWNELPENLSPRYRQYARANASIGINGTVVNNVNASPNILTTHYLQKVKALADVFRPYGIKIYISVNFSSPAIIGGLPTSDPLNSETIAWWHSKVAEIYTIIPDFGGFLVKANSEGQPGPQDFGRTHADGANMLAAALKKHGGIVMWRAFVYNPTAGDRAKQAFDEFTPLDGLFADNVIVQVKNGPIDFQPREPFNPLFGGLKKTLIMPELQITQEYLGQSKHLVFLAPMWQDFFESDTYCNGQGSLIKTITTNQKINAIAGVANIGEDANWCGSHFAQANWYAFGRMAWNPNLTAEQIADEWLAQTFIPDKNFTSPATDIMLQSWEACINYMMPLGLHHLFAWEHHYGPQPWCDIPDAREDWLPKYYHRADSAGLGFDRTTSGSNAVAQYHSPLREQFDDIKTCPEKYALWFHHLKWNDTLYTESAQKSSCYFENGSESAPQNFTLWEALCYHYNYGVAQVRQMQKTWQQCGQMIDTERFVRVQSGLKTQARDAMWWRDACLLYFQTFSKQQIPFNMEQPVYELEDLKKINLGNGSLN